MTARIRRPLLAALLLCSAACARGPSTGATPDAGLAVAEFDVLPNGGRIEIQAAADEPDRPRAIRKRLGELVLALRTGDLSAPSFAYLTTVPGATTMAERHDVIHYLYRELPRGAEVRITTNDRAAQRAVQEFLAYQRMENAAGRELP